MEIEYIMQLTDKPKVLYIGQYSEGTTSKQRADTIKSLLDTDVFRIIDLHEPFYRTSRVWRSIGFRYKKGPLIPAVNTFIRNKVQEPYDLIWVDKGIYITAATTAFLRAHTKKLVHFTPDPAFTFHKSRLFYQSLKFYDYVITTKSYELERYFDYLEEEQVLFVTQGFDPNLHQPDFSNFDEKEGLLFIGHYE
ncbi:MAG TPA: hypothetical protein DDY13_14495, partial [Cytophagales bacterium]|nr:hypothetical protein [Cytophagales bacterium]